MITPKEIDLVTSSSIQPASPAAADFCVLLVEDDAASRRYLEIVLERAGYKVMSAADGLSAMKVLLSAEIDAVVTDAMMPNLNGNELCRFIRNSARLTHLPVVLLSALDPKNAASEAGQADAFLSKPVSPDDLLGCIADLIQRRR